jgi:hypothetical protein
LGWMSLGVPWPGAEAGLTNLEISNTQRYKEHLGPGPGVTKAYA